MEHFKGKRDIQASLFHLTVTSITFNFNREFFLFSFKICFPYILHSHNNLFSPVFLKIITSLNYFKRSDLWHSEIQFLISLQVQGTNDRATLSKFSTVTHGYYEDKFLQYFVSKTARRAPIIHWSVIEGFSSNYLTQTNKND